jgi:HEAT repeat protein
MEVRLAVARAIARRGDDHAAWILIRAMRDAALTEARLLEQLGRPFAATALLEALHMPDFAAVRAGLCEALGLARHVPAAFAIARLLRYGTERERTKACRALGRIARPQAVPLLIDALQDRSEVVRALAARALGAIGDARAVEPLAGCLGDRDWWVRSNAAEALRHCGHTGHRALVRARDSHPDRFARERAREAIALVAATHFRHAEGA